MATLTAKNPHRLTVQESLNQHRGKIIRITPTISATAYDASDVLFLTTEIPDAVAVNGGTSRLIGITMLSQHDATDDIGLIFMENSTNLIGALSPGSSGGAALADGDAESAKMISCCVLNGSDNTLDLGANRIYSTFAVPANSSVSTFTPMLLQAAAGSTSVYVAGIAVDAQDYAATDDLDLIFHIEYR